MDRSVIMLVIAVCLILFLTGSGCGSFQEAFTTGVTEFNNPNFFVDSCKALIKEKSQVAKLAQDDGCNKPGVLDLVLPNRDSINKKIACKNLTDKKIMLDMEQPSWCDRAGGAIAQAPAPVAVTNSEGPEYMQTQYTTVFGSLLPNESNSRTYVGFSNMSDQVGSSKYTSL